MSWGQNVATVISCLIWAAGGGLGVALVNGWLANLRDKDKKLEDDAVESVALRLQLLRVKIDLQRLSDYNDEKDLLINRAIEHWRDGKSLEACFDMLDIKVKARPKITMPALPGDGDTGDGLSD